MKLLLLEDDQILNETLALFLTRAGYSVDVAHTMEEAEEFTYHKQYDLYLLDINLSEGSGLELLANLRHAEDNTPTIFITALTDMHSISEGFRLGAIDYIKKPFDPQELLIRLKAKLKRETLFCGDVEYDQKAKVLRKNGQIIDIGNVQYKIFTTLLLNCGNVVTKEELYECLEHISDTALRVAITKIKQRLDIPITNIRGKGYLIEKV
ncbi:MAG TPA: response regulator transcription factor [Epsilonproteobacteria bacterium]|nr:response regulator transcription factor [Campylobacterota bacterium]